MQGKVTITAASRRLGTLGRSAALACTALLLSLPVPAGAEGLKPEILKSVFHLTTRVPADARSAGTLGTEREGSAILIDENGLLLTVGYLLTEAISAEATDENGQVQPAVVLGVDQDTGLGILRAEGLNAALVRKPAQPIPLGSAASLVAGQTVLVASFGGMSGARPARIISRRDFAGGWEYLLESAIFTAPPHPAWSGAALIDDHGALVGVGSLLLADASGEDSGAGAKPGNMFIPIDKLKPVLSDLQERGRPSQPAHPWLGISLRERSERLLITHISAGGPAEKAGLTSGAEILGVGGKEVDNLADLYRRIWATGNAGTTVPLTILDHGSRRTIEIRSMSRYDYLKANSTF